MHIQREGTEQIVFQQLAQLQTGRFHVAQHTATAVAQRAHLQPAGRTADLGRQRSIRSKGRERSVEFAGKTDFTRIFCNTQHLVGQILACEGGRQPIDIRRRSRQFGNVGLKMSLSDIGQSLRREIDRQLRVGSRADRAQRSRHIGHRTAHISIHVGQRQVPILHFGREIGDVVGRQRRIDDLRRNVHLLDEILVKSPIQSDQRKRRQLDIRLRRPDVSLPDIDTAVGDTKTARQVFDYKSAALAHRQTPDVGMDHRTVNGEILQFGPNVDQVHIGEIHSVRRIAVLQPFHAEIQPLRFQALDLQPEFSLRPGLVLFGEFIDHLLDVHLPVGSFAQAKTGVRQFGPAENEPSPEQAEALDPGIQTAGIKQRIPLEILDIESVERNAVKQADIHPVNTDAGTELAGDYFRRLPSDEILSGRNLEQQGDQQRQKDQRQHDRRHHLGQYVHYPAHYPTKPFLINCKFKQISGFNIRQTGYLSLKVTVRRTCRHNRQKSASDTTRNRKPAANHVPTLFRNPNKDPASATAR